MEMDTYSAKERTSHLYITTTFRRPIQTNPTKTAILPQKRTSKSVFAAKQRPHALTSTVILLMEGSTPQAYF